MAEQELKGHLAESATPLLVHDVEDHLARNRLMVDPASFTYKTPAQAIAKAENRGASESAMLAITGASLVTLSYGTRRGVESP